MKKLRKYIEKWVNGESVRGIHVSLYDIQECISLYNGIKFGNKPSFINGKVKEILDKCGIETISEGIGWKIV